MADYEVRLQPPAEAFVRNLDPEARERLGRLLDILEIDPRVDGRNKIIVMVPPTGYSCYVDAEFWILYHIRQNTVVSVLNIDFAGEKVTPWRFEPGSDRPL